MQWRDYWQRGEIIPASVDTTGLFRFVEQYRGWVYIAQPSEYPDLVKIGYSKKPLSRMLTLRSAGVLGRFTLLHSTLFANAVWAETHIHSVLSEYNVDREFFKVPIEIAKTTILNTLAVENTLLGQCPAGLRTCPTLSSWLEQQHRLSVSPDV